MADHNPSKSIVLRKISELVNSWTKIYNTNTKTFQQSNDNLPGFDVYETILSQSDSYKPIPDASTRIYFYIPSDTTDISQLRFRLENETLYHSLENSMDLSKFDDYITQAIEYKREHRLVYFLATDFEKTRIADIRIDELEIKKVVQIPPEERLGISQPDLIASTNRLLYSDVDAIIKKNIELFGTMMKKLSYLIDPFKTKFVDKTEFIEFLNFLGIKLSKHEFDTEIYPMGANDVIMGMDKLKPLLSEVLMSKLIFHKGKQIYVNKKADFEQKAKIMFKNKYKPILDRFVAFLIPLARNKALTLQTVTLNLEKLKNSLFTEKQYIYTLEKINEITVFDENSVRLVYNDAMMAKLDAFVDDAMKLTRSTLETYLLAKLGYGKISYTNYIDFFNSNSAIRLTKRQKLIIWKLLELSGFLIEGLFNMDDHVFILAYYIEHILKLNEYFTKKVDVHIVDNFIIDDIHVGLESLDDFIGHAYSKWHNIVVSSEVVKRCYKQVKEGQKVSVPFLFSKLEALNGLLKEWYINFTVL